MEYLEELKPGKRENAFYVKSDFVDEEEIGIQSAKSGMFYVHLWDPETKRYVEKLISRSELDALD